MKFSDYFQVEPRADFFDIVLSIDTPVYVDPFLIFDNEKGIFEGAHDEITSYFIRAMETVARSQGAEGSPLWKRAERMLLFPEVEEFCLGVSAASTGGAGSGPAFAKSIAQALWIAIEQGMDNIDHFEQVQLFRKGINKDRISDAVGKIIRHRFASYTKQICNELNVDTHKVQHPYGAFNFSKDRWESRDFALPRNPYNKKPILLVPKEFLRDKPSISKDDFWSYCSENEETYIAENFSDEILRKADAEKIVAIAISNPEIRARYLKYREEMGSEPYDGLNDPKGFINW